MVDLKIDAYKSLDFELSDLKLGTNQKKSLEIREKGQFDTSFGIKPNNNYRISVCIKGHQTLAESCQTKDFISSLSKNSDFKFEFKDQSKPKDKTICSAGEFKCEGMKLLSCGPEAMKWIEKEDCSKKADSCNIVSCDSAAGCVLKNKADSTENCDLKAAYSQCQKGVCKSFKCKPRSVKCNGKSASICKADGSGMETKDCQATIKAACKEGVCDSKLGCIEGHLKKGSLCNDNKFCSIDDQCDGVGNCKGSKPRSCKSKEVCDNQAAACLPTICEPLKNFCLGKVLSTCNSNGTKADKSILTCNIACSKTMLKCISDLKPQLKKTQLRSTSIKLSWDYSPQTTQSSFEIEISENSGFSSNIIQKTSTKNEIEIKGLKRETVYFIRLRAVEEGTKLSFTPTSSFKTLLYFPGEKVVDSHGVSWVYHPGGKYLMGTSNNLGSSGKFHPFSNQIDGFFMMEYEVNYEVFLKFIKNLSFDCTFIGDPKVYTCKLDGLNHVSSCQENGQAATLNSSCFAIKKENSNSKISYNGPNYEVLSKNLKLPVDLVSYGGARTFCKWLDKKADLPLRGQWEYASTWDPGATCDLKKGVSICEDATNPSLKILKTCSSLLLKDEKRIGCLRKFPWGSDPINCLKANHFTVGSLSNCGKEVLAVNFQNVDGLSSLKLSHILGNVAEWNLDKLQDFPNNNGLTLNFNGKNGSSKFLVSGGSYKVSAAQFPHFEEKPNENYKGIGFRCAKPIK